MKNIIILLLIYVPLFGNGTYNLENSTSSTVEISGTIENYGTLGINNTIKVCWKKNGEFGLICYKNEKIFMPDDFIVTGYGNFQLTVTGLESDTEYKFALQIGSSSTWGWDWKNLYTNDNIIKTKSTNPTLFPALIATTNNPVKIRYQIPINLKDGRLEVFSIGLDKKLWHVQQSIPNSPSWSGWGNLGGWHKQICVEKNKAGGLEVFAIGSQNKLWHKWQTTSGWTGWKPLGGFCKQICVGKNQDGRLEVFAIGNSNKLWHIYQLGDGTWSGWHDLGGWHKQICVERNQNGRLEVFAIGSDNKLYSTRQVVSASGWSGFKKHGGYHKQICVGKNQDGRLEVFAIGSNNKLWHKWQKSPSSNSWSAWYDLGGFNKQISVGRNQDGRLEVFAIGSNDKLYSIRQAVSVSGWSNWKTF